MVRYKPYCDDNEMQRFGTWVRTRQTSQTTWARACSWDLVSWVKQRRRFLWAMEVLVDLIDDGGCRWKLPGHGSEQNRARKWWQLGQGDEQNNDPIL